jgi:hypothetical protein
MLSMLSEAEIWELTGKKKRDGQIMELRAMGIQFLVRSDDSIVVARAHVEHLLGVKRVPETKEREPQVRFDTVTNRRRPKQ